MPREVIENTAVPLVEMAVPAPFAKPLAELIRFLLAADNDAAKKRFITLTLAAKRLALKKARGG